MRAEKPGVLGFEPRNAGIKTRCLTAWLHPIWIGGIVLIEARGVNGFVQETLKFPTDKSQF